jgi:hypothetical protein
VTLAPSRRSLRPAFSTAEIWTNTSLVPRCPAQWHNRMLVRKELEPVESRDWDVRATKAIEQARKMPLGHQRSDALKEAGRLRIAAEMNRWLSTK